MPKSRGRKHTKTSRMKVEPVRDRPRNKDEHLDQMHKAFQSRPLFKSEPSTFFEQWMRAAFVGRMQMMSIDWLDPAKQGFQIWPHAVPRPIEVLDTVPAPWLERTPGS